MSVTVESFKEVLEERGWVLLEHALDGDLVDDLRADLEHAYGVCRAAQLEAGLGDGTDGTVHHAVGMGPSFLRLLEHAPFAPHLDVFFGGKYILNSFGGVLGGRASGAYVGKVHRDVRSFTRGVPMMMNVLVMLDDFTAENGGTRLLSGSHRVEQKPEDEHFLARADTLIGPAGSVALFDSNLWHAAGVNTTGETRRALTLTYTKPYLKQQLDYPRLFGYDRMLGFSDTLQQVLGYRSRVPSSLDEWYQPPERRFYRPDQG